MDYTFSLIFHFAILAALLLLPIYFTQSLNMSLLTATFLFAPPPPPPSLAVAHLRAMQRPAFISKGKLFSPEIIPKKIEIVREAPLPPELGSLIGGVPGGIPGGQAGGVLGGIFSGIPKGVLPPPPKLAAPFRIGGSVKPPRALYAPEPVYPVIARIARIQGNVVVDAVIDEQGNVVQMKVVSGTRCCSPRLQRR